MRAAGVDIGNSTTEVIIGSTEPTVSFLGYASVPTTGLKGTKANAAGVSQALQIALSQSGLEQKDLDRIYINETAPVVNELSTDIISQTLVVGSAMIGHNPNTPGGLGLGVGITARIGQWPDDCENIIAVIPPEVSFENAARQLNEAAAAGRSITGAIACKDDGVLIANRLDHAIPIVDEVRHIERVPLGERAAVEVAGSGTTIKMLSNPYGIAGLFGLTPEQTRAVTPIARTLIGSRSGVVIYSQDGKVDVRRMDAGTVTITGNAGSFTAEVSDGADKINQAVRQAGNVFDVTGNDGTNAGAMFRKIKNEAARLTGQQPEGIKISDLSAVDTIAPIKITGGIADEYAMENVVLLSSMVKTSYLPMRDIAEEVRAQTGIEVEIGGKEAKNALVGAMTTKGTAVPMAILDLGGGSTDAAYIGDEIRYIHTAGAGDMVTTMIDLELALGDRELAEQIKRYPLAKAESLNVLRFEDQTVKFVSEKLPPEFFARTLLMTEDKIIPIRKKNVTMEQIVNIRREAKRKVFTANAVRALEKVAPGGNLRKIGFVVMVGGSALDFEVPDLINEALAKYNIVAGRGNVLGQYGPRAAVAAGLVINTKIEAAGQEGRT